MGSPTMRLFVSARKSACLRRYHPGSGQHAGDHAETHRPTSRSDPRLRLVHVIDLRTGSGSASEVVFLLRPHRAWELTRGRVRARRSPSHRADRHREGLWPRPPRPHRSPRRRSLRPEPPPRPAPQHPFVTQPRSEPVATTAGGIPPQTCTELRSNQRLPGSRPLITAPTSAGELTVCVASNAAKSVRCPACHWVICSGDRGSPPMIALPPTCHRSR